MCKPEKHTAKKQCKCKTEEGERKKDFKLYILFAFYIFLFCANNKHLFIAMDQALIQEVCVMASEGLLLKAQKSFHHSGSVNFLVSDIKSGRTVH